MNMLTSLRDMLSPSSPLSLGKGTSTPVDPLQGASDFAQMLDTLSVPSKMSATPSAPAAPATLDMPAAPVALDMPAAPNPSPATTVAPALLDVPATPVSVAEAPAAPTALDMPAAPDVAAGPSVARVPLDKPAALIAPDVESSTSVATASPLPSTATPITPAALDIPATTDVLGARPSAPIAEVKADAPNRAASSAPLALPTVATPEPIAQDPAPLPSLAATQPTDAAAPSEIAPPVANDGVDGQPILKPAPAKPSANASPASIAVSPATRPVASDPIVASEESDADDGDASVDDGTPTIAVAQSPTNPVPIAPPIAVAATVPQATRADGAAAPISIAATAPTAQAQSPVAPGALSAATPATAQPEQANPAQTQPANASSVSAPAAQSVASDKTIASPDAAPPIPHAEAPAGTPRIAAAPLVAPPSPDQSVPDAFASVGAPISASSVVASPAPVANAPVPPTLASLADAPASPDQPLASAATPAAASAQANRPAAFDRASRSDAVSLLQLARDHMAGRVAPSGKDDAARPSSTAGAPSTDTASLPASGIGRIDSAMIQPSAPTMQPATSTLTSMPVVNLSASLGAQVVDMGVSGQWIDGLARDIAGLSANGAQGRFQIQADQLGPVQVDIRSGDGGSSVVLTVENAAAEAALRRDSDQLRFDAGGSAARISDVKIERGPMAADAIRPDQSATQQQSAGQGQTSQWQGQSAAQHQQQARSQGRENPLPNAKAAADAVVINHGQAGDAGEPVRARYA